MVSATSGRWIDSLRLTGVGTAYCLQVRSGVCTLSDGSCREAADLAVHRLIISERWDAVCETGQCCCLIDVGERVRNKGEVYDSDSPGLIVDVCDVNAMATSLGLHIAIIAQLPCTEVVSVGPASR